MTFTAEQSPSPWRYPNCFGCGGDNSYGLQLEMKIENGELSANFTPAPHHQGWPGIVHGGIISALLYEVMENWTYLNGIVTMMRSMNTRLIAPARVGRSIRATSWQESREGREICVAARLESDGKTVAEGSACLVELDERRRRLITGN
jgi:acyl-coenzyme A thioesterase PaaI-like protein